MMRSRFNGWTLIVGMAAQLLAVPAQAVETVTYSYDALGRLTSASASGGPEDKSATTISYDKAGNRIGYAVVGAGAVTALNLRFIVVPLNGYILIPVAGQ